MYYNKKVLVAVVLSTVIISSLSTYIHHPETPVLLDNWGLKYNDIVYGVFNPRFSPYLKPGEVRDKWYNVTKYYMLTRSTRVTVIPYIDYKFEYPPIIGLLWLASVNTAIYLNLPEKYTPQFYRNRYEAIITTHYMINAIVNTSYLLLTILFASKIILLKNKEPKKIMLFLILPSMYLYLIYNWDIICSFFVLTGLYYFYERKWLLSGALLGLSISAKILPAVLVLLMIIYLLTLYKGKHIDVKTLAKYMLGLAIGLSPFIFMLISSPRGFTDFITYHASWYCENCLYQVVVPDVFSSLHKVFSSIAIGSSILLLAYVIVRKKLDLSKYVFELGLISMLIATSLNYVFTPQMILLITPLAIVLLDKPRLIFYWLSDLLNFLIMGIFFIEQDIRIHLHNIGLPVSTSGFNPWTIASPVQWAGVSRDVILLGIAVSMMYKLYKKCLT